MTSSTVTALTATSGSYQIIKDSNVKPLSLVHDLSVIVHDKTYAWKDCPLRIHESEAASLHMDHVFSILTDDGSILLSTRVGIREEKRIPLVKIIDEAFEKAIQDYRRSFELALKKDMLIYDGKKYHIARVCSNVSPGWLGRFLALFAPVITKAIYTTHHLEREGSRHRVMWMKEIDTKEQLRLQDVKNMICLHSDVLFEELQKDNKSGIIKKEPLLELDQLNRIYQLLFSKEPLTIKDHVITEYLCPLRDVIESFTLEQEENICL